MSNYRIASFLILLSLLSCSGRRGPVHMGTAGRPPGWSVLIDTTNARAESEDNTPEGVGYIQISRNWKHINSSAFVLGAPSDDEVTKWGAEFERVNPLDSIWEGDLTRFKSVEQLICNDDFFGILNSPQEDEFPLNNRMTEWRLLQYAGNIGPSPRSELDKVLRLKGIWEDLLDRDLGPQCDMEHHAWLSKNMHEFQIWMMYEVCLKHLASRTASAFRAEKEAACRAQHATSGAYRKMNESPAGFSGSSYPYCLLSFETLSLDMELIALESFMRSLLANATVASKPFVPVASALKLIDDEYAVLEAHFEEDEESHPVETRIEFMEKDKAAWHAWIRSRSILSSLLSGRQKVSFDNATLGMCRHKLIMLKNRYETGDFCPYYYGEILLDYDSASTEAILSHDFEELLKKKESSMEEEHETLEDSLAAILSARLGRTMKMKDPLASTYTDGEDVYYWNHFWGDMVKVPEGFEVSENVNWSWQIPHGTNFHGVVDGKDTVDVFVYAACQAVHNDDDVFREEYLPAEISERQLVNVSSQFKYRTVTLKDGSCSQYLYCVYDGVNSKTGKGEYHKYIRCLPDSTLYDLTVIYPLPKSRKIASIIKELSTYPNITDYSHLGSYNAD